MQRATLTLLLLVPMALACAANDRRAGSDDADRAAATITPSDVYQRIAVLSADSMRGRDTPSPELERTADWIAARFAAFGLEPAGDEGWLQRFPYPAEALDPDRTAFRVSAGATHSFEYGTDFFARTGAETTYGVGAVFVGSSLERQDDALRDRAVLVELPGLPQGTRAGFRFPRDVRRAVFTTMDAARDAGATAVVFLLDPGITPGEVAALAAAEEEPRRSLGGVAEADRPLPAFFLAGAATDRLLRMAGLDRSVLDAEPAGRPVPLPGVTLRLAAPTRALDDARPPNVVGLLRGSDPALRDTYVVLSAHMDHVGVGRPDETGDSIYNGADDNASGTAVLVEVAEAMATLNPRPRRSLLFLAVSGEEKGLLGSRWFADNPTVPIEAIVANVNMDMIGRNAPDSIVVIGQEYSTLGRTVQEVARERHASIGLTVAEDIWPEQRFFFRSDHFSFARREVPALFFFAGTHEDYHRPGDEVDEIDTDKTARVGRLAFFLTHAVAESDQAPEWDPEGLETVRSLTRD